ncbi:hypothetical protein [Pseudomonas sp. D2002]|uniref:hypothetical protein n=1 Tax=Pseudomonas sp. D2002 TaxID=2726980 RepID=UPI00210973E2|nr:hypothetical protein [Pseudomonas sp. D2002]
MLWILAHYTLYTYIAAFLASVWMADQDEQGLFAFGVAAQVGLWITGVLIDGRVRRLMLLSLTAFTSVALAFGVDGLSVSGRPLSKNNEHIPCSQEPAPTKVSTLHIVSQRSRLVTAIESLQV